MSYWSETFVDGVLLDLSHLEPFEFTALPAGAEVYATVSVRFNDHRPGWPADTGEMKFNIALAKVLRGDKPRFPPR